MPQFRYRGAQPDGTVVSDRIEGDSEPAVRAQLEGQGLLIFKLEGAGAGLKLSLSRWRVARQPDRPVEATRMEPQPLSP